MSIKLKLEKNKQYIINQYLSGISTNKLGQEFNCNSGSIYHFLKSKNIPIKKRQLFNGNIKDIEPLVVEKFNSGLSSIKIAKELNLSKPTVLRILHKFNCKLICDVDYSNLLKDKKDIVVNFYKTGKSVNEIANIINHSQSSICKLLKNEGFDLSTWKYNVNETFFETIDTEYKAYILGWFYSDGCVDIYGKCRIGIQEEDKHILEEMKIHLNYDGPLLFSPRPKPRKNLYNLVINRQNFANFLIKQGCVPNKSLILTFPEHLPNNLISHFLRGMNDGDGSITKNYWSLTTTDKFNLKVKDILKDKFNINSSLYYRYKHTNTCSLFVSKKEDRFKILTWLYKDSHIHLQRKYDKYLELKNVINGV